MLILSLVILVLIIISGFFAGAETAITAVSQATVHKLKLKGNKKAITITKLRKHKEHLISTLLLGNSACNICASTIATTLFINLLGNKESTLLIATLCMTIIIFIFAEVLPKAYAFEYPERFAFFAAPIVDGLIKLFYPVITAIQVVVKKTLSLVASRHDTNAMLSGTDELRGAIELHHHKGSVVKTEKHMLDSILDLSETEIGEIMIHRKQMITVSIDLSVATIIEQVLASGHTRVPVWQNNPDNIIGILNIIDLFKLMRDTKGDKPDLKKILTKPWYILEHTTLKEQLNEFRARRNHFALVIDEYGALLGMVTLEDILEEIVGQIEDEHDQLSAGILALGDGTYIIDGTITIRDLNRELDWMLPDDKASTVAGLIMHETEIVPEEGEQFEIHGVTFTILEKRLNQIYKISAKKLSIEDNEANKLH